MAIWRENEPDDPTGFDECGLDMDNVAFGKIGQRWPNDLKTMGTLQVV